VDLPLVCSENVFIIVSSIRPSERVGPTRLFLAVLDVLFSQGDKVIVFTIVCFSWAFGFLISDNGSNLLKDEVIILSLIAPAEWIGPSTATKWHVSPDYGELDDYCVGREADSKNGEKTSGWTNPLGWTDDGDSDDLVLAQTSALVQVADGGAGKHETEKVHALEPISTENSSNFAEDDADIMAFPTQRTAFYVQLEGAPEKQPIKMEGRAYNTEGYGPNGGAEKVSVPDARITHSHTTFYDKKNGLWRQDQAAI